MFWKLKGGMHEDNTGRRFVSGDIIESDEPLDKLQGGKFHQVHEPVGPLVASKGVQSEVSMNKNTPVAKETPEEAPAKRERTSRPPSEKDPKTETPVSFEGASEIDLVVKRTKGGYNVYDDGECINDKPISKKAVAGLIKKYTE